MKSVQREGASLIQHKKVKGEKFEQKDDFKILMLAFCKLDKHSFSRGVCDQSRERVLLP